MAEDRVEYFKPTSGQLTGFLGIIVVAVFIVMAVYDGMHEGDLPVIFAAAFVGILIWAAMLRPRVGVSQEVLVMRNMVSEAKIPLAAIEQVALRQVLAVRAGDRRFVSPAIGRSLRSIRKQSYAPPDPVANYADFVEQRIRTRMDDARARSGISRMSEEQLALGSAVRLRWAWPELAGLIVTGVGFVVALFV